MTRMTGPDCVVMCNLINTYIHTYIVWHRMTRMTGLDCVVMCNLINTYIHTYIFIHIHTYIHTYIHLPLGVSRNPATEDNRCSCSSSLPGGL